MIWQGMTRKYLGLWENLRRLMSERDRVSKLWIRNSIDRQSHPNWIQDSCAIEAAILEIDRGIRATKVELTNIQNLVSDQRLPSVTVVIPQLSRKSLYWTAKRMFLP